MKLEFIPIDYDYFDFEGKNFIKLIGRTEKGKKICVIDSYEPNFWIILKKGTSKDKINKITKKIEKITVEKGQRETKVEKIELRKKKFLGEDVQALQIFVSNHKDAHDVASEIGDLKEIEKRREYDIPIITKYIKEKKIQPLIWHSVEGTLCTLEDFGGIADSLDLEICIKAEKITETKQKKFEPKILAYDIETDETELGKGNILMISLYGKDFKKVLTWKHCNQKQDYVECFEDEAEMLEKFVENVREYDPDILTGYFSDGFDLPYLKAAAEKNKIKLALGIDNKQPTFTRGRIPSGKISGIVHVDLYRFIDAVFSQYLQSETLSLNEVAKELVDERKEEFDFNKLPHMTDSDWRDFFSYNLQDARVTHKLAEKIWPDMIEFSKIVKEPLFDVTRDRMSTHVGNYILQNLDRFDEIAEKRPMNDEVGKRRAKGKYEGAFVFQPTPGLYENLVMFDFTSMYASVIVSYNLSLSTLKDKEKVFAGKIKEEDAKFSKEQGFFPIMLNEIIEKRKEHKKEFARNPSGMQRARSNAYKLLANASYGYQGFFGARYYCREAAAATASLARKNIHEAINKIEKAGHKIIYSDTDSIAFLQEKKTKKQILDLLKKINSELPGIMELDLEDFYKRGLFVSKRTTKTGAKKKYALLDEKDKLKIRGFETVRRDWCQLARKLQNKVLNQILHNGNEKESLKLLRETISKLQNRKVALKELIIRTQLKKPINEYLAEGPHVVAAKKMEAQEIPISPGMIIEYFIGEINKPSKRIGDKVFLPDEKTKYNIDYYLNNQILPPVENIFDVFDINVKEIAEGHSQSSLGDF
jgi:DNA polymerase elongation subunit (family B)